VITCVTELQTLSFLCKVAMRLTSESSNLTASVSVWLASEPWLRVQLSKGDGCKQKREVTKQKAFMIQSKSRKIKAEQQIFTLST